MLVKVSLVSGRIPQGGRFLHASQYFLVIADMLGSMVSCRWDSVSQITAAALLGIVVFYWVVVVVSSR